MIQYYSKQSRTEEFRQLKNARLEDVWVHIDRADIADIDAVIAAYSLDGGIVRDVRDAGELPRSEYRGNVLYTFLRVPRMTRHGTVVTSPLLLAVTEKAFISIAHHDGFDPKTIMRAGLPVRTTDTYDLLAASFAAVVSEYETLVQHTGRSIRDIGRRLRDRDVSNQDFLRFVTIEDNLNEYEMNLDSTKVVARRLIEDRHKLLSPSVRDSIEDVELYIEQLLVAAKSHSQSITSIRNAYGTIANNTLNQRMKTLTVLTVLIALPNVFYGMYGMNVALPFAEQPWAYGAIVVFTIIIIIAVYAIARRIKIF